jgi:phosphatidylserine decarboxylase
VFHYGEVNGNLIEQIKGVNYDLDMFLGPPLRDTEHKQGPHVHEEKIHTEEYARSLRAGNSLFFVVIYLAPGDYHRFHSPCSWNIVTRRHFPGDLFSVSPFMAKYLQNLFVLNERVVLLGKWKYGAMAYVSVGATNVGSIVIHRDPVMLTLLISRS